MPIRSGGRIVLHYNTWCSERPFDSLSEYCGIELVLILGPPPSKSRTPATNRYAADLFKKLGTGLGNIKDLSTAPQVTLVNLPAWAMLASTTEQDLSALALRAMNDASSFYPTTAAEKMTRIRFESGPSYRSRVGHDQSELEFEMGRTEKGCL